MSASKNQDLVILAIIALGALVLLGQKPAEQPRPHNDPPKPPDPAPDTSTWVPYDPAPLAIAQHAKELLAVMALGDRRLEADPTSKYSEIEYRCQTHPPSAQNPSPHKGVDVWRPKTTP
jgi:hypothetical protein